MSNKVSISKAARMAGVSRTTFYKNYLDKGVISKSKDSQNRAYIELSELLRVFPESKSDTATTTTNTYIPAQNEQGLTHLNEQLKQEILYLKLTIEAMKENEQWLKDQLSQQKLIENTKKRSFILDVIDAIKR